MIKTQYIFLISLFVFLGCESKKECTELMVEKLNLNKFNNHLIEPVRKYDTNIIYRISIIDAVSDDTINLNFSKDKVFFYKQISKYSDVAERELDKYRIYTNSFHLNKEALISVFYSNNLDLINLMERHNIYSIKNTNNYFYIRDYCQKSYKINIKK